MTKIFLHGLGQNPESWKNTVERLWQAESCVCPDLTKTHGEPLTYQGLYRGLCGELDGLESPLAVCGLSLGGVLALNFAAENPGKVGALVLIAAQYKMPKNLLKFQNLIFRFMPKSAFSGSGLSKSDTISLCRTMAELDFSNLLSKISCPTLIICGKRDRANIKAAREISEKIKNGRLMILQNSGHEINTEKPEELADIIEKFYREISGLRQGDPQK